MMALLSTEGSSELTGFLTRFLHNVDTENPSKIAIVMQCKDDCQLEMHFDCNYCDLRRMADVLDDEAMLQMLARSQEHLDSIIEDITAEEDS